MLSSLPEDQEHLEGQRYFQECRAVTIVNQSRKEGTNVRGGGNIVHRLSSDNHEMELRAEEQ